MSSLSPQAISSLSRHWIGSLSPYRLHRNDEHREALICEAMRFCGLRLETDLSRSAYWSEIPLLRRAAVLLYLVDRGAVVRKSRKGRPQYELSPSAEVWAASQPALAPYLSHTLELLAALRSEQARRESAAP